MSDHSNPTNDNGAEKSKIVSVATMALETEMEECYARFLSGHVAVKNVHSYNNNNSSSSSGSRRSSVRRSMAKQVGDAVADQDDAELMQSPILQPFRKALVAELERVSTTLDALNHCTESHAKALLKNVDGLSRRESRRSLLSRSSAKSSCVNDEANKLRQEAVDLQAEVLSIREQTQHVAQQFTGIAQTADSKFLLAKDSGCLAICERRMRSKPWTQESCISSNIVILLSDIFHILRSLVEEEEEEEEDKEQHIHNDNIDINSSIEGKKDDTTCWVAPKRFNRATTKYWVTEEDIPQVLLKSVSELPILVYGNKSKGGRMQENPINSMEFSTPSNNNSKDLWKSISSCITSVYFDSVNMDLYKERIARNEGAQLFRVRWYGQRKPTGTENIFLELKTHHEEWTGEESVKERVAIQEQNMGALIDISTSSSAAVWTTEYAREIVRNANPNDSDGTIEKGTNLLLEIRNLICKLKLRPCVRTTYLRVALQSSKTNNLRLTIDRDITVVNETAAATTASNANVNYRIGSLSSSSWCLSDETVVPWDAIVKIPYGVFEVKVAAEEKNPPKFLKDLQASNAIVKANKFSKFLTGAAIYNKEKIETLPWWASDPSFVPLFNTAVTTTEAEDDPSTQQQQPVLAEHAETPMQRTTNYIDNGALAAMECINDNNQGDQQEDTVALTSSEKSSNATKDDSRWNSMEEGKSITTSPPYQVASMTTPSKASFFNSNSSFFLRERKRSSKLDKRPSIAPKKRVKPIEPKTHFANERTFLQWAAAAVTFMTFGALISSFTGLHSKEVFFLFALALIVSVYAPFQYYRRIHLMTRGKYTTGYSDYYGPGVFSAVLIIATCMMLFLFIQTPGPGPMLVAQEGTCVKRSLEGVSRMTFQPSDAFVDEERGLLLVPSLDKIVGLSDGIPVSNQANDARVQTIAENIESDIEALQYLGSQQRIYALSGGGDKSGIISLEWTRNGTLASQTRWDIPSFSAKSMAYAPKSTLFEQPVLIVASEGRNTATSRLDVYEGPFDQNDSSLKINSRLNFKSISRGLNDTNVAAIQYFEGLLFLLFDNEQLIRAVDKEGNVVQDVRLPTAELGFEKNWKGINLQRVNNDVVLHLALNAPAQIWSIKLDLDDSSGCGFKLPFCAAKS